MERNNFSTKTEEELMVPRIIRMAKLLNRYFLVYFLYRDAQKCTGKGYLTYKDDETSRQLYNKYYKEVKNRKSQIESVSSEGRNKIESEVFKVLKNYINDDCTEFDIVRFVKEEKAYFNLLPEEIRGVDEGVLSSMAEDARKNNEYVSFVKICLEKLFDSKFRDEFNKKTENFLFREEKRCRDENKLPDFYKFDMVRDFLKVFSTSYSFIVDDRIFEVPSWSFDDYNSEIGQRNNGDRIEKVNNLYSGFKLYGHGEYSKLLIAYRSKVKSKSSFDLIELRSLGLRPIIEDDELVEIDVNKSSLITSIYGQFKSVNEEFQNRIKNTFVNTKQIDEDIDNNEPAAYTIALPKKAKQIDEDIDNNENKIFEIDKLLHSRFKGNYIPQELDGMYNSSDSQKTLRKEIVELLIKKSKKNHTDNNNDVWTKEQCSVIKNLFIEKVIKTHTQEDCLRKSDSYLFKNYDYNKELSSKKYLSISKNITISDLFKVLMDFDDEIKDVRTGGKLQAWEEILNSYHLNPESIDKPVGDEEDGNLGDFIKDEKDFSENNYSNIGKAEEENQSDNEEGDVESSEDNYSRIDQSTPVFDLLMKRIEEIFGESIDFENFLKDYLNKWNMRYRYSIFFNEDNTDKTDIVYRAVRNIYKEKVKIIEEAINKVKDCKVYLSRYENVVNNDFAVISLRNVFNSDDETVEKIWMAISLESLKNKEDRPWRELVNIYKSRECIYSDDELKYMEKYVKQSMQMIYDEILKFKEKKDDKKRDV